VEKVEKEVHELICAMLNPDHSKRITWTQLSANELTED